MRVASPIAIIAGASMARLSVISATMSITARGAWATLPNSAIIATITNGAGSAGTAGAIGSRRRQIPAPSRPPMTMPGPKIPPEPPEPIDSDVARIFANGRARIIHSGIAKQALAIEAGLDPAVARAQHSRDHQSDAADDEASDSRPQLARQADRSEPLGEPVEGRDVEAADDARGDADQRVVEQLAGILEPRTGDATEDRREADERAEDGEGDDRGDE